jgi:hypothetical protein
MADDAPPSASEERSECVRVVVRCRPMSSTEAANGNQRYACCCLPRRHRTGPRSRIAACLRTVGSVVIVIAVVLVCRIVEMDLKKGNVLVKDLAQKDAAPKSFPYDAVFDWRYGQGTVCDAMTGFGHKATHNAAL